MSSNVIDLTVEAAVALGKKLAAVEVDELRLTDEEARWLFDEGKRGVKQSLVIAAFKQKFGKIVSQPTVSRYARQKVYEAPSRAGRNEMMCEVCQKKLIEAFRRIRADGTAVEASLVAAVAVGIQEREHRGSTRLSGGAYTFSVDWANKFMHFHGINVRRATTDRTVSADIIVRDGKAFFTECEAAADAISPDPRITYNMDEFFCCYSPAKKAWTWELCPRRSKQNIVVRDDRAGFTCSITTAADDTVVLLQFIFKDTQRVHTGIKKIANVEVLECSQENSHFQNADTFKLWCAAFKRVAEHRAKGQKILLFLDMATQHESVHSMLGTVCTVLKFPPGQTHVFQPADQFVIACLKSSAKVKWNAWVAMQFAQLDIEEAVAEVNCKSLPVMRLRKVTAIQEAAEEMTQSPVITSWEKTGLPRILWQAPPHNGTQILYDLYVEANGLNVQVAPPVNEETEPAEPVRKRGRPELTAEQKAANEAKKAQEALAKKAAAKAAAAGHKGPNLKELWAKKPAQ